MTRKSAASTAGWLSLAVALSLGGFAVYQTIRAPAGTSAFEATRVALDPQTEYAVLRVKGMT